MTTTQPCFGHFRSRTGFLRRAECEIYFEVRGSGPALLFAHGLGGNHLSWWQQLPHFSDRYTCVVFSHRGFPPSTNASGRIGHEAFADDLGALLDHLDLEEVILVAQSMGGWTCLTYALRSPERVKALVMSSSTGTIDFEAIDHPAIAGLPAWNRDAEAERQRLDELGLLPSTGRRLAEEQPALYSLYEQLYRLTPPATKEVIRRDIRSSRHLPPATIRAIRTPILFVVGQEDLLLPPAAAVAAASLIPGARLCRVPRAGHSVYFERPDVYNRLLDDFLAEHSGIRARVEGASSGPRSTRD